MQTCCEIGEFCGVRGAIDGCVQHTKNSDERISSRAYKTGRGTCGYAGGDVEERGSVCGPYRKEVSTLRQQYNGQER